MRKLSMDRRLIFLLVLVALAGAAARTILRHPAPSPPPPEFRSRAFAILLETVATPASVPAAELFYPGFHNAHPTLPRAEIIPDTPHAGPGPWSIAVPPEAPYTLEEFQRLQYRHLFRSLLL
jgi:hypothetical protein